MSCSKCLSTSSWNSTSRNSIGWTPRVGSREPSREPDSCADVCVCHGVRARACVCVRVCARARARVCVCMNVCIYLSMHVHLCVHRCLCTTLAPTLTHLIVWDVSEARQGLLGGLGFLFVLL